MDSAGAAVREAGRLVADRRDAPGIGRRARLELVFALRRGRTILAHAYAEPPLRAGRPIRRGGALHLIMATSAPGIFGGDSFTQQIVVERGARVRLTSQSALQAHPAPDGAAACLECRYVVEDAAELACEWDPLIPFAGASLTQRLDVQLADGASLYWSDAFMSGREGAGERWAFAALAHELSVRRGRTLEYLERYRIAPAERPPGRSGMAEEAGYFGTVVRSGGAADPAVVERLHVELASIEGVRGAVDRLGDRLVVARLMARSGAPFRDARAAVSSALCGSQDA